MHAEYEAALAEPWHPRPAPPQRVAWARQLVVAHAINLVRCRDPEIRAQIAAKLDALIRVG